MSIKQTASAITMFCVLLITACSASGLGPEAELWGKWEFSSGHEIFTHYSTDLEFTEDGSFFFDGDTSHYEYAIIAPGRIKISKENESEVVFYEVNEERLTLSFGSDMYQYKHVETPTGIGFMLTETPTHPIDTPIPLPTEQHPTSTTLMITITPIIDTPTIEPTQTELFSIGSNLTREIDGMLMAYVPGGSFIMGSSDSDNAAYTHEKPQHEVFVDAFWMDVYEVSNAMFKKFVDETGYQTQAEKQGYSEMYNSSGAFAPFENVNWRHPLGAGTTYQLLFPVTHVNQLDAQNYCNWAGGRLPTEAEWEKAARGENARIYPWGETFNSSLLHSNGNSGPASIYSYSGGASPYGILNMAGNVFEWTSDWYDANYYSYSPYENPTGPSTGEYASVRGGAWTNSEKHVRTAHRDFSKPYLMNHLLGFRCVMDPN